MSSSSFAANTGDVVIGVEVSVLTPLSASLDVVEVVMVVAEGWSNSLIME